MNIAAIRPYRNFIWLIGDALVYGVELTFAACGLYLLSKHKNTKRSTEVEIESVNDLKILRTLDASFLQPIGEAEASAQDGVMLNHSYVDLRGYEIEEVAESIACERQFLCESAELAYDSSEMEDWLDETALAMGAPVEIGVCSAVQVLSAIGATPISSCNGGAFTSGHASDVAHVLFSCGPETIPDIMKAAETSDCGLINNGVYAELYAAKVEDLIDFADTVIRLKNVQVT